MEVERCRHRFITLRFSSSSFRIPKNVEHKTCLSFPAYWDALRRYSIGQTIKYVTTLPSSKRFVPLMSCDAAYWLQPDHPMTSAYAGTQRAGRRFKRSEMRQRTCKRSCLQQECNLCEAATNRGRSKAEGERSYPVNGLLETKTQFLVA